MSPTRGKLSGRAILSREVAQVADILADPDYRPTQQVLSFGARSILAVPMVRSGDPVGAILIYRREVGLFPDKQVMLLQTFADQAVIAIENVRLFNETKEALERQTATSEILRVISSSPTDAQPVFEAIAKSALHLCDSSNSVVGRYDGELLHLAAHAQQTSEAAEALRRTFPMRPNRATASGRALLEGCVAHIPNVQADSEYAQLLAEVIRARATLAVPMLRDGQPIGTIAVGRLESRPFSDKHIALLQTFADQAVLAIENVRLFTELQEKNKALTEAHAQVSESLEQKTAASEILRVISQSPTDVQPVFDAIAESAVRLCDAEAATVTRFDGEWVHIAAMYGLSAARMDALRGTFPMRPSGAGGAARAVRDRAIVHIPDVLSDKEYEIQQSAMRSGYRGLLAVPMLHKGQAIGAITLGRAEPGEFSDTQVQLLRTFADQAVIAIENVRLFTELQQKNEALTQAHAQVTETLEQQTATGEILRVIASSPTDVQPVFDAIASSAARLCRTYDVYIRRLDEDGLRLVAHHGPIAAALLVPVGPGLISGRAVRERRTVHVVDVQAAADEFPEGARLGEEFGHRTNLGVPLLREGVPLGVIGMRRAERNPFTDQEIALLQTFADQAVIAIENVRLFTETKEALDRQTATSEILRVISQSPTDVQPVFDTIVRSAVGLCDGLIGALYRFDGELLHLVAHYNYTPEALEAAHRVFPGRPSRGGGPGRAILDRAVAHIPDVQLDLEHRYPAVARAVGWRSGLFVPMLREGAPIGVIAVTRAAPRPFSTSEIELLKTFADQAVIAIENVRLFTELQEKNQALTQAHAQVTEALEQQTATSEILGVISSSPTDVQPVFDTIVASAGRLCGAESAVVYRFQDEMVAAAAVYNLNPDAIESYRRRFPRPLRDTDYLWRVADGSVLNIADITEHPHTASTPEAREPRFVAGMRVVDAETSSRNIRSFVLVPMVREGQAIGAIGVSHHDIGAFADERVRLLRTFADQAVIAIENVRLFTELQARTQQLTRSVEQLTALGEVGQVITSTLDLQTVLGTIVARATQLTGLDAGIIYEYDEQRELFEPRATERLEADIVQALVATPIRRGEGATGKLADLREPIQVSDVRDIAQAFQAREVLVRAGYRAALAVPLVREDRLLGGLTVFRKTPGEFAPEVIDLLRTFATQSALAIQNARLFREIEDKSRQLEAASQHKSEFLANMSHELRTPLNAIIGFSEVLSEKMFGELNEKQEEYSKDIHASGQHLLSLINDILDLSKIEAGRMELELTNFHLPTALDSALTLVRERAGRRGIALHMSLDGRLGLIQADERKVRQVVLNLLSNAIKFTPEGGRIGVAAVPKDGSVEVSVRDTGVGIAPEDQEAVFEEFRQVGTADKKVEGTGLGLTLCRKFVELHGGKIWVKSQVGQGSTFTFTIPMRAGE
jgi:GAF domain-containing protein/anti-sigma regulatory factor (Ser/Thr protein kinase)